MDDDDVIPQSVVFWNLVQNKYKREAAAYFNLCIVEVFSNDHVTALDSWSPCMC